MLRIIMKAKSIKALLIILLGTLSHFGHAQQTKIFPDSLGTHWIFTATSGSGPIDPRDTCNNGGRGTCYWLERDTFILAKRYIRMAYQRGSFEGTGNLFYWFRSDTISRRLYLLDSAFQEQLLFDFSISAGDSTPVLYNASIFAAQNDRYYKGIVSSISRDSSNGRKWKEWFVNARSISNGQQEFFTIPEGLPGDGSYTPLTFDRWSNLENVYLTCFNEVDVRARRQVSNFFCGCNELPPPIISGTSTQSSYHSNQVIQLTHSAPIRLNVPAWHGGGQYAIHDLQGRMIEKGHFGQDIFEVLSTRPVPGIYVITLFGGYSTPPLPKRLIVF